MKYEQRRQIIEEMNKESIEYKEHARVDVLIQQIEQLIGASSTPEDFFTKDQYETDIKLTDALNELGDLASNAVAEQDFSRVIDIGRRALAAIGVEAADRASNTAPNDCIAIVEAINLASKEISYGFYALKPSCVVAASQNSGVFWGYNNDDGTYALSSPSIGTASFYDPYGEVYHIFTHVLEKEIPSWEYPWSGVIRQDDAFKILEDVVADGTEKQKEYAERTTPQEIQQVYNAHMRDTFKHRFGTLADILSHKRDNTSIDKPE